MKKKEAEKINDYLKFILETIDSPLVKKRTLEMMGLLSNREEYAYQIDVDSLNNSKCPQKITGDCKIISDSQKVTPGGRLYRSKSKKNEIFVSNFPLSSNADKSIMQDCSEDELKETINYYKENDRARRYVYVPDGKDGYSFNGIYSLDIDSSLSSGTLLWQYLTVMVEDRLYRYDKMYYIESLGKDEPASFDVGKYVNETLNMGASFCEKIEVENTIKWKETLDRIITESSSQSIPIIHIECHGDRNGNLILGGSDSSAIVRMKDFIDFLCKLEKKCREKILLTTAVCHGLSFFNKVSSLVESIPCSCVVGSFTKQSAFDIEYRYKAFFKTLLNKDSKSMVKSAFKSMSKAYDGHNKTLKEWSSGKRYAMLTGKRTYYVSKY